MGLTCITIILSGIMSFAAPNVLENVAATRAAGLTAYPVTEQWGKYDTLIAVEDCGLVGEVGTLSIQGTGTTPALIVDCQAKRHRQAASLSSLGLLADTNRAGIVHRAATLTVSGFCYPRGIME